MEKKRDNPTIELSELDVTIAETLDGLLEVRATLRMAAAQEVFGETSYSVGCRTAYLRGTFEGAEIAPGTKYGEQRAAAPASRTATTTKKTLGSSLAFSRNSSRANVSADFSRDYV